MDLFNYVFFGPFYMLISIPVDTFYFTINLFIKNMKEKHHLLHHEPIDNECLTIIKYHLLKHFFNYNETVQSKILISEIQKAMLIHVHLHSLIYTRQDTEFNDDRKYTPEFNKMVNEHSELRAYIIDNDHTIVLKKFSLIKKFILKNAYGKLKVVNMKTLYSAISEI